MQRYWDIADALRQDIAGGRYAVGDKLPTEEQLVEAFGASRHTVREALRLLTEDGLISRRPRAGSLVIGQSPLAHFTQRVASIQELINYPATTERRPITSGYVQADHELAVLLRCAVGSSWFCIETLRFAAGSPLPLCHTHVYVRPEYAGIMKHRKHGALPFADQIADLYGVTAESTDFEISASLVEEGSATVLQVPAGSAALTTVRRYAGADGQVFEVSIAVHPAQRYTFNFHLKREKAALPKRTP
ncbi:MULTISPECIES: GntR family transcriptional regulator [Ramlibacter]|jgi:DNA-binding GntR family transcriptional regulator|uniref:GntR family transcriptional regulator n=1 Tax=Ramlibacter pinisoli TaxID=2682844 RepID=A0A6N8IWP7_9BURK|nr:MULTISPECIES: GntR family transcriptional regulator [Ramlibacter]MBA2961455.1 GntR family transcriptional regulator [Ramlibacter sp. CGMCC 1.13660]MVQ31399.1 GntR family transcriptional regulator [Ramlibacter pinisoli]